jgi:hypothetical protein
MKILDKLQNPFALIAQGFVAGAIIIFATMPPESDTTQAAPTAAAAPAQEISQA